MSRAAKWLVAILLLLLTLSVLGGPPPPVIFVGYLIFGWIGYLARVIPQVQSNWMAVFTGALCLVGVISLGHMLGRWLLREMTGRSWKMTWTVAITAIIVLMFVAGIGAVGVAHQSVWLARSERPMFRYERSPAHRVKCASNLRQIGQALMLYAKGHGGQLPDSFSQLYLHDDITPELFVCAASVAEKTQAPTTQERSADLGKWRHCSYVYLGRGLKVPAENDRPLATEPLTNHDNDGMNILFADGRVEFMTPAQAHAVMEKW
jgi:prepilin-type processing-associated H-X9-DG protein